MRGLRQPPQLVLLVGGRGTRLRPLTDALPKCLLPVCGRPFLEYVIERYAAQGVRDVVLCSGYRADMVVEAIGDGSRWDVAVRHSVERRPLGTIGALRHAFALLDDAFLVSYGDTYLLNPIAALVGFATSIDQPAVMTVVPHANGNALVVGTQVVSYDKQARASARQWLDYGMLALERRLLFSFDGDDEQSFYGALARSGCLAALPSAAPYHEIGTPQSYQAFCETVAAARLP